MSKIVLPPVGSDGVIIKGLTARQGYNTPRNDDSLVVIGEGIDIDEGDSPSLGKKEEHLHIVNEEKQLPHIKATIIET